MTDETTRTPATSAPVEEAAPIAPTVSAAALNVVAAAEAWFVARINNSPVSRDTAIYNYVRSAVDDLKTRLASIP